MTGKIWLEKGINNLKILPFKIYICGGQVRDLFISEELGKDVINTKNEIDIVIYATSNQVNKYFRTKKNKSSSFDVFDFNIGEYRYEAKTITTSLQEETLSRDLNINSMYLDLDMNWFNKMTDNTLDMVKDNVFIEDPIRIIKWDLTISKLRKYKWKFKSSERLKSFQSRKDELLRTQSPNRIKKVFESRGFEIINVNLFPTLNSQNNKENIIKNYHDQMCIYGFDKKWLNLMNQNKKVFWNVHIHLLKDNYYPNNIDFRKQAKHWNIKYNLIGNSDYNYINKIYKLPDSPHFSGHKESVKQHIEWCIVESRMRKLEKWQREVVKYHDYGKLILAHTREFNKSVFYGHEEYSSYLCLFLKKDIAPKVSAYVLNHMKREHEYLHLEWFNEIDSKCREIK